MKKTMWMAAVLLATMLARGGDYGPTGGGTNIYLWTSNVVYATGGVYAVSTVNGGTISSSVIVLTADNLGAATTGQLASAIAPLATTGQVAAAVAPLATTGQVATAQAACDINGAAAAVAALRSSGTVFGLGKAGPGLTASAGVLSAPLGNYYASTNYHAALTWDCSLATGAAGLDVTNDLAGAMALTCTNMVAGQDYTFTATAGSVTRNVTIAWATAGKLYATPSSYASLNVTANTLLILTFRMRADGSIVYNTTGPCTQ